ncbi:MAG: LysR family transcriptional regulator [Betaproteobacteria bacterium]|nr:LysR family transcriptional regulator [Betaproteobacteria bacterium]
MNLSDLHIFKTVVEEGGIIRAARKLHRVQSNITTRIKQLESSVDAQLFFRDKQRLFLSPNGELLLGYADKLLRLAEEAKNALSGTSPRGVFRLGALESTTASRLPKILALFHKTYPDVRVDLKTGTNDTLTADVADRRLDAAFVAETPSSKVLSHMAVFTEKLVLISSHQHSSIRRPLDIHGDTVIAFPSGCAYRRVLERWLGDRSLASVRVFELASYHAIVACVASGTGIALVPESVLATVQSAQVTRHALPKIHSHVVTPLIWRRAEQVPALVALRELIKSAR